MGGRVERVHAGNVAARGNNGKGISGVAPNALIMGLRFIGNEGGTTAAAIKAIKYADLALIEYIKNINKLLNLTAI